MSLYLGKLGRKLVKYSIENEKLGKTASAVGDVISRLTSGRYKTGLTRLAYTISENVKPGDKLTFKEGMVMKGGNVIAQDDILRTGKDIGEITVCNMYSSPEGMASFLRHVYFKPKNWGIRVSGYGYSKKHGFHEDKEIWNVVNSINSQFGIKPDNSFSLLFERPDFIKLQFLHPFIAAMTVFGVYLAISGVLSAIAPFTSREYSTFPENLSCWLKSSLYFSMSYLMYFWSPARLVPGEGHYVVEALKHEPMINVAPTKRSQFREVAAHEYIHYLCERGLIKNQIIANSAAILTEPCFSSTKLEYKKQFIKGLKGNLLDQINKTRIYFKNESQGLWKSYGIGAQLAGMAFQVTQRMKDPLAGWRFIKMVSGQTDKKTLVDDLKASEFGPFLAGI